MGQNLAGRVETITQTEGPALGTKYETVIY
jgi:hypothetical protein